MKTSVIIQRVTALLIFLTGFVFGLLGLFGVTITVNQADVNNIIFGFSAVIAALIEFIPTIIALVKDKNFRVIFNIVNDVVWSVEELEGLSGPEKKTRALIAVQKICSDREIDFDPEKVGRMIESVINVLNTVKRG